MTSTRTTFSFLLLTTLGASAVLALGGCSSSSKGSGGATGQDSGTHPSDASTGGDSAKAPTDGGVSDTGTATDASAQDSGPATEDTGPGPQDSGVADTGTVADGVAPEGGAGFTLTINNFDGWCGVTENGAASMMTETFPAGTVVHLDGMPLAGFVWGYWTGTDGAADGGDDTNMMTTVTMTGNKTVLACCPFPPPASQTCQ